MDELTHMEFMTLGAIEKNGLDTGAERAKISDIAHITNAHTSALSRTLNGLEAKGCIRRTTDSTDRRNTYVEFTEYGRKVLEKNKAAMEDFMSAVFGKVGDENMKQFIDILCNIYEISQEELDRRIKNKSKE